MAKNYERHDDHSYGQDVKKKQNAASVIDYVSNCSNTAEDSMDSITIGSVTASLDESPCNSENLIEIQEEHELNTGSKPEESIICTDIVEDDCYSLKLINTYSLETFHSNLKDHTINTNSTGDCASTTSNITSLDQNSSSDIMNTDESRSLNFPCELYPTTCTQLDTGTCYEWQRLHQLLLECSVNDIPKYWCLMNNSEEFVQFFKVSNGLNPVVQQSFTIHRDGKAHILVHGQKLPENHHLWSIIPDVFTIEEPLTAMTKIMECVTHLSTYKACLGSHKPEFQYLVDTDEAQGMTNNTSAAFRETGFNESYDESIINSTIRSRQCQLLVKKRKTCKLCNAYGHNLPARHLKHQNQQSKKNAAHASLKANDMKALIKQQSKQAKNLRNKISYLQKKVNNISKQDGPTVPGSKKDDFQSALLDCLNSTNDELSSFQKLFMIQQLKAAKCKKLSGMRWHPNIVKFCLQLRTKSRSAYDALRNSEFLTLPSSRTLNDYTSVLESDSGFEVTIPNNTEEMNTLASQICLSFNKVMDPNEVS